MPLHKALHAEAPLSVALLSSVRFPHLRMQTWKLVQACKSERHSAVRFLVIVVKSYFRQRCCCEHVHGLYCALTTLSSMSSSSSLRCEQTRADCSV